MTRLLITAAEASCGLGRTLGEAWPRLLAGESAARDVTVPGLEAWPGRWMGAAADVRPADLIDGLLATSEVSARDVGLCLGASKGDLSRTPAASGTVETPLFAYDAGPSRWLDAVRRRHRFGGPAACVVSACASGLTAVVRAAEWVQRGLCEAVIAGAADASLNPLVMASYRRAGVLSSWEGDASGACRPFDRRRSGFVIGEGCGVLLIESAASATARGATPLVALSGWDTRTDPTDLVALSPRGEAIAYAVRAAIADAGLRPSEIDAVCCHGTGTRLNDRAEANGLRVAFGPRLEEVPCVSLKPAIGHTLGASGAVELAFAVEMLRSQMLPPRVCQLDVDPDCPIGPLPRSAASRPIRHLLKLSAGFGGPVAAVVLSAATAE